MFSKPQEKKTFFLYNIGRSPDVLALGNIMVGSYSDPDQLAKYVQGSMSSSDMQKHTVSTDLGACAISNTAGVKVGPNIDVMSLLSLGLSIGKNREKAVSAEQGKRVILKDPAAFLDELILGNPTGRDKITLLLSAAARHRRGPISFGKVKLWMLTGYYLLKDAQITQGRSKEASATANVDSTTAAAAGGIPVGGGLDLSISKGATTSMQSKGWLVWAAQWRALDVRDTWAGARHGGRNALMMLRMDVVSRGIMYAASPEQMYASLCLRREEVEDHGGLEEQQEERPAVGWWDWMTGNMVREDPRDVVALDELDDEVDDDFVDQCLADELKSELEWWEESRADQDSNGGGWLCLWR